MTLAGKGLKSFYYTVFAKTKTFYREKKTILFGNYKPVAPWFMQWTFPNLVKLSALGVNLFHVADKSA